MEDEDQKVSDLVKELVRRLLSDAQNPKPSPDSPEFLRSLRYAIRILSSRMTPSVAPDADAISESVKRRLATMGKSSQALTFADLYSKFASKTGPGSVNNKWAVVYLLKTISDDRKGSDCSVLFPNLGSVDDSQMRSDSRVREKGWSNGVVLVSRDSENLRDVAVREFVNLVKEESEVSEEAVQFCALPSGLSGDWGHPRKSVPWPQL